MFRSWGKPKILVVGSALIDTVAEREIDTSLLDVEPGEVTYSIGGASYNIAVNLALENVRGGVGLFTYLPPSTTTTDVIVQRLRRLGVSTRHVHQKDKVLDDLPPITAGGFVGIRNAKNKQVHICAVEEVMGVLQLPNAPEERAAMDRALNGCRAVVVDTGLNRFTIAHLMRRASEQAIPMFVHLVSARKAPEFLEAAQIAERQEPVFCVTGKPREIRRLLELSGCPTEKADQFVQGYTTSTRATDGLGGLTPAEICRYIGARHVVVTPHHTEDGHLLVGHTDQEHVIPLKLRLPGQGKGNLLGVSEAIGAALIYECAKRRGIRADQGLDMAKMTRPFSVTAQLFAQRATGSLGATPLSVISGKESYTTVPLHVWVRRAFERIQAVAVGISVFYTVASLLGRAIGISIYPF
jgi:sugar/nucleoside kinase (ribokinase family)